MFRPKKKQKNPRYKAFLKGTNMADIVSERIKEQIIPNEIFVFQGLRKFKNSLEQANSYKESFLEQKKQILQKENQQPRKKSVVLMSEPSRSKVSTFYERLESQDNYNLGDQDLYKNLDYITKIQILKNLNTKTLYVEPPHKIKFQEQDNQKLILNLINLLNNQIFKEELTVYDQQLIIKDCLIEGYLQENIDFRVPSIYYLNICSLDDFDSFVSCDYQCILTTIDDMQQVDDCLKRFIRIISMDQIVNLVIKDIPSEIFFLVYDIKKQSKWISKLLIHSKEPIKTVFSEGQFNLKKKDNKLLVNDHYHWRLQEKLNEEYEQHFKRQYHPRKIFNTFQSNDSHKLDIEIQTPTNFPLGTQNTIYSEQHSETGYVNNLRKIIYFLKPQNKDNSERINEVVVAKTNSFLRPKSNYSKITGKRPKTGNFEGISKETDTETKKIQLEKALENFEFKQKQQFLMLQQVIQKNDSVNIQKMKRVQSSIGSQMRLIKSQSSPLHIQGSQTKLYNF